MSASFEAIPSRSLALRVQWTSYRSPVGPLTVVECPDGPLVIEFAPRAAQLHWANILRARDPRVRVTVGSCAKTVRWLERYFDGRPEPAPYPEYLAEWLPPTPSQDKVWRALCEIPLGETRSYQDIAIQTGLHPRVVGQLNGANHLAIRIPCHRVIGKNGSLVGYGGGLDCKRWLLAHELRLAGFILR